MWEKFKDRFIMSFVAVGVIFAVIAVQLSNLTISRGVDLTEKSEGRTIRTLTLKGHRGEIQDVNGIPLAYDQSSFNVEFTRDPSRTTSTDRAYYTDVLIRTIEIVEANGGKIIDTFNLYRQDDGSFAFDFGVTNEKAVAAREKNWRSNMYVGENTSPDQIYRDLRYKYRIPEDYTYEQARKLLSIWQEVQLSSYRAYEAVTIASNISTEAIALLEAETDLDGIAIAESSTRVYPKDDVAAHIIGYMGKMTDNDMLEEMQAKGYSQDDTVGITGIENTMESFLTGNSTERQGKRKVEVNSRGKVIQELSNTPATDGYDVRLTIDVALQQALEQALAANVQDVYERQLEKYEQEPDKYDNAESLRNREGDTTLEKLNLAKSGAGVVMDVHTGNILAMASYPSYDLNLFEGGISGEAYQELLNDPAAPLFNKAVASKGIPGSIFKMVTGTAGLAEGYITRDSVINDEGPYTAGMTDEWIRTGGKAPACWVSPDFSAHQNGQTILEALRDSCNYFFYTVADEKLGIDKLKEWSDRFGLTEKTGVELPGEVAGQVGCQETLFDWTRPITQQKTSLPILIRNQIVGFLRDYGEQRNVTYEDDVIEGTADALMMLVQHMAEDHSVAMGPQIRAILSENMEIPETITRRNGWDADINTSLTQLVWNRTRTANTGIGTDLTALTPIAVARYISALVNGGTVYEAHLVDCVVDGNGNVVEQREPQIYSKLDVSASDLDAIREGLREVVSDEDAQAGGAASAFEDWKYKNTSEKSWIGGKTGTGKVVNDVDLENNAWFVAFAPYDEPEIAVVIYIPNGMSGVSASPAARDIIGYYLDCKLEEKQTELPAPNTLLT
ncbi:MAG: hypothetical protein HDQ87_01055 [Clostridia bacterium]|nr:hypothetical protein [Clostridia bacterium]